jgi:penicillin amidase
MQGYLAAKDRLFQFEIWRRQATGTVSEIFGEEELDRDIGTRLFKFRGNMEDELNHYHEDGFEIVSSFVSGINKYIEEINKTPSQLPIEFKLLGIKPEKWTNEDVISTTSRTYLGNIEQELNIGRAVSLIGEEKVKELMWFHPKDPNISLDNDLTYEDLKQDILRLYNAYREPIEL